MTRNLRYCLLLSLALTFGAIPHAEASFHLWTISEIFSNADGTIQFVELSSPVSGEEFTAGQTLRAIQGATIHTFTFPSNTPTPTANRRLLIATAGYASLPGAATPDFTIPSGFLFTTNGSLNYADADVQNYGTLPTDGYNSRHYPGGTTAPNSPTNFAGSVGPAADLPITDPLPPIPKGDVTIELTTVVAEMRSPIGMATPDDGSNRLFIYDQAGSVTVVQNNVVLTTPLLDASARLVALGAFGPGSYDERGLLGLAVHPDFANHPQIYSYTSEPTSGTADFTNIAGTQDHQSVIAEWTMTGGDPAANTVDPSSRREILRIDQPAFNHNAGTIRFGPDGFLFISLGDGGDGDDQGPGHVAGGNAQDTGNIYGSLLRIDVDRSTGTLSANGEYSIPPTNPLVGQAGLDEIYVFGLRNPYAFSFDMGQFSANNFRIFLSDAGQNQIEEVDLITPAQAGHNLGWPVKEGSFYFNDNGAGAGFVTATPPNTIPPNLVDPLAEYDHGDGTVAVGGSVYRGTNIPELQGHYVFGEFGNSFVNPSGRLWYLDDTNAVKELKIGGNDRALGIWVKGFGQDRNGEVYVMGSRDLGPFGTSGVVLRLRAFTPTAAAGTWMLYR